jgi:hypothetical protein
MMANCHNGRWRAQLATEGLLTGLLYVELDFHEETQPKGHYLNLVELFALDQALS